MATFTRIPTDTFKKLQMNAGILCSNFTPADGTVDETDLLGATSGGIAFSTAPEFTDFGEDIDNCPKNTMELKRLDSMEVTMSGSFVTVDTKNAKLLAGIADIDKSDATKIVPRRDINIDTDFTDIWFVGDYSDVNTGDTAGYLAIHLMNALSTGGFSMQTSDKGKGMFEFTFMGHFSMAAQDKVPYEIYVKAGTAADSEALSDVTYGE